MELTDDTALTSCESQAGTDQHKTISQRKLNANRENAKKSTGPRTPRGKAYSRKNAITHGLFTRANAEFIMPPDAQEKYEQLIGDLWDYYEPLGNAEELEVQRIAVCWWRLKRAWQYENAVNHSFSFGFLKAERTRRYEALDDKEEAILLGLRNIEKERFVTDQAAQAFKQRFLALTTDPELWQMLESFAEEELKKSGSICFHMELRTQRIAWYTLQAAISHYELKRECRKANALHDTYGERLIPDREALDKLLRYETTIERSLGRSLDRLERLQRRRKREPVLLQMPQEADSAAPALTVKKPPQPDRGLIEGQAESNVADQTLNSPL